MAVRDGGKRTRFACLETTRGVVATTVSVLTVAVVVMVTIAALRPVDFSLSIVNGMDSNPRWLLEVKNSTSPSSAAAVTVAAAAAAAATTTTTPLVAAANATGFNGSSSSTWRVAEQVNLTFSLLAYNPSGRKEIRIFSLTVRVVDMPRFPSFDGMRDIAAFPVPARPFTLKRQGSHNLRYRKFSLRDAGALSYVGNTYGAEGTFEAMVLVDAFIGSGSDSDSGSSAAPRNVTYYCWPVLVGWSAARDSPTNGVTCLSRKELSIDVDSLLPQPAPPLTPAAG